MPAAQLEFLASLIATKVPLVVCTISGGAVDVSLAQEHAEVQVTPAALREFAEWLHATHAAKLNRLSAVPFTSADAVLEMLAWPLESL